MQTNHFLTLLSAELASCEEDIHDLELLFDARFKALEITNYVYRENNALLKQETSGIRMVRTQIDAMDPDSFPSLDDAFAAVLENARETVRSRQLPEAIISLVSRRAERVRDFVRSG